MFGRNGKMQIKLLNWTMNNAKVYRIANVKRNYNTVIDRITQDPITNANILGWISSYQMTMLTFDISAGTTFVLLGCLLKLSHPIVQIFMKRVVGDHVGKNIQK